MTRFSVTNITLVQLSVTFNLLFTIKTSRKKTRYPLIYFYCCMPTIYSEEYKSINLSYFFFPLLCFEWFTQNKRGEKKMCVRVCIKLGGDYCFTYLCVYARHICVKRLFSFCLSCLIFYSIWSRFFFFFNFIKIAIFGRIKIVRPICRHTHFSFSFLFGSFGARIIKNDNSIIFSETHKFSMNKISDEWIVIFR